MEEVAKATNVDVNSITMQARALDVRDTTAGESIATETPGPSDVDRYKTFAAVTSSYGNEFDTQSYHYFNKNIEEIPVEPIIIEHDYINNSGKVSRMGGLNGYRATTELESSKKIVQGLNEIELTAIAVQWLPNFPESNGVYFSDGKRILRKGPLIGINSETPEQTN